MKLEEVKEMFGEEKIAEYIDSVSEENKYTTLLNYMDMNKDEILRLNPELDDATTTFVLHKAITLVMDDLQEEIIGARKAIAVVFNEYETNVKKLEKLVNEENNEEEIDLGEISRILSNITNYNKVLKNCNNQLKNKIKTFDLLSETRNKISYQES